MNPARPNIFARIWSTFKAMPVGGKVATIAVSLVIFVAMAQDSQRHRPSPPPAPPVFHESARYQYAPSSARAATSGSQALSLLIQQHSQLAAWAQQCMAQMNQTAQTNAMRAMQGQMPIQAPCTEQMYQVNARIAVLEAQIGRLQGGSGDVCSITGYCAPAPSSTPVTASSSYEPPDDGTGAVERTSREGTLGQCIYNSDDGYTTTQACDGGDHYWQNVETGQFVNTPDAPNDGYDYRQFSYSRQ